MRFPFRRSIRRPQLALILILLLRAAAWANDGNRDDARLSAQKSTPQADTYIGSKACAQCHKAIYDKFSATHMGQSLSQVSASMVNSLRASASLPASIYDERLDRHFEVSMRDGKLYQSEYQTSTDGKEIFRNTQQIEWIIGSGMNGFGGIVRRDGYLFQGPLSFYSKADKWALSPGYEFGDYGFNRPILAGCITCHSGRPKPVAAANGQFENPAFEEMAIGCENCHGPGALHARSTQTGDLPTDEHHFIVNPANLSASLTNNICMSCHQTGDLRILKPGKDYSDFRPGTPLDNTLSILMVPPKRESPPQADHLEHYYSMTLSKCFRASAGRMSCITCHDPHVEPTQEEAPAYFNQRCLSCHSSQLRSSQAASSQSPPSPSQKSCSLPLETRMQSHPADNCVGCHMPKREVTVIQHSSVTSHRILARPDEPFPAEAFDQTTAALPDLIHLNPAQLNPAPGQSNTLPALTLLQAYGELADNKPEYVGRYSAMLSQIERTDPNSELAQAALGRRDLRAGNLDTAVDHLEHALKLGPPQATTYADLSEALLKSNHSDESVAMLQRAIELDPFNPVLQKTLMLRYIQSKQYPRAKAAMERYLAVFPQDSFVRHMMDLANSGASPQ